MSESESANPEFYSDVGLMLVTANVGSLFEDPTRLLQIWLKEFIQKVTELQPQFLALHLQEVGGKTYEKSMEYVQEFIRCLCDASEIQDYIYVRIYMDEDFKSAEHFTALGNIYFAHKSLTKLRIWNFLTHDWETAKDRNIYSGSIETISTKEKSKFPQHFFPECKWSRKGFMRTRWEINGTVIDLVNIHLFHDASNLAACEEFPSVYCKTRRRALVHTLERFHLDEKNGLVPFFVFGDFNFRCDTEGVVKELTENLSVHRVQSAKTDSTKIHYRNSTGNNVLTVGKKEFNHADHQLKFKEDWLRKYDRELEALCDVLVEYPITFAPSYPFEEDPEMPTDYMSTRCPSWCDRILMSPQVQDVITEYTGTENAMPRAFDYKMIGEAVCMGDHKPIYLNIRLKSNQGTFRCCDCNFTYMRTNNSTAHLTPAPAPAVTADTHCPHNSDTYTEILAECLQINREKICAKNMQIPSGICLTVTDGSEPSQVNNDERLDDQSQGLSKYPPVSINIIDTDNIYVCMCTQMPSTANSLSTAVEGAMSGNLDGTICPECRYIIKKQPIEHRCRLISKRLMLSENIIVNRIDAQHLSTYLEEPKEDPYTPESNESHSPCPEFNSTSTTNSSNNRSPYERISPGMCQRQTLDSVFVDNIEPYVKSANLQATSLAIASQAKPNPRTDVCDNQLRGVVTPRQLKSRLEDLQRSSMQNLLNEVGVDEPERDCLADAAAAAEPCAVDNVEDAACPPKTGPLNPTGTIQVPLSLKQLVNDTLGDEIIWKEQSQTEECGLSSSRTRYVLIQPLSTDASDMQDVGYDNENGDLEKPNNIQPETDKHSVAILKETTV